MKNTIKKTSRLSSATPIKDYNYRLVGKVVLPSGDQKVNIYVVDGGEILPEHLEQITSIYKSTYHPDFSPVPDAIKWVILTDELSNQLLASTALNYIHDNAVPFTFGGIQKGGSEKVLAFMEKYALAEYGRALGLSFMDVELGTFCINMHGLKSFKDIATLATVLFFENTRCGMAMKGANAISIATNRVRHFLHSTGIEFYELPEKSRIIEEITTDWIGVKARMLNDMGLLPEKATIWLQYYLEYNIPANEKKFDVKVGVINSDQVISVLRKSEIVKSIERFEGTVERLAVG